jgi:hypothetical protein
LTFEALTQLVGLAAGASSRRRDSISTVATARESIFSDAAPDSPDTDLSISPNDQAVPGHFAPQHPPLHEIQAAIEHWSSTLLQSHEQRVAVNAQLIAALNLPPEQQFDGLLDAVRLLQEFANPLPNAFQGYADDGRVGPDDLERVLRD